MTELQQITLRLAAADLGKKEATGKNDGPFVEMIQRWAARGGSWMEKQPWCAAFATWKIHQAGLELGIVPKIPRSGSSTSLYKWFKENGYLLAEPQPGCIGLIKGGPSWKTHQHTFLVESVVGDKVLGIDGNWKNAVSRSVRPISMCDFGRII